MKTKQAKVTESDVDNIKKSFRVLGVTSTNDELQQEISHRVNMLVVDTGEVDLMRSRANRKALPARNSLCIEEQTQAFLALFGKFYWNSGSKAQPGRAGATPILESDDRSMFVIILLHSIQAGKFLIFDSIKQAVGDIVWTTWKRFRVQWTVYAIMSYTRTIVNS